MVYHSKKGGDSGMNIEQQVNEIQLQIDSIKQQLKTQSRVNEEAEEEEEEPVKQQEPEEEEEAQEEKDEEQEQEQEQIKPINIKDQQIEIPGFSGTVKELTSSMKGKKSQLTKNNAKRYSDKITNIDNALNDINTSSDIESIKNIISQNPSITFKNNKMMGGKTKKKHVRNGRKSKKKRHSKKSKH